MGCFSLCSVTTAITAARRLRRDPCSSIADGPKAFPKCRNQMGRLLPAPRCALRKPPLNSADGEGRESPPQAHFSKIFVHFVSGSVGFYCVVSKSSLNP